MQLTPEELAEIVKLDAKVKVWRVNPHRWVDDVFGGKIKLSNQQRNACKELGWLVSSKIAKSLDVKLTEKQEAYAKKIGVDISSGMGTGKDFWVSLMMFWMLHVFPIENGQSPHVLATANTAIQLSNVLWRQASVIPGMSVPNNPEDPFGATLLGALFECQSKKIFRKEFGGKSFFAEAVTVSPNASSDEQSRALTGRHAPYLMMVLDEAAGLPEAVFTNLEGTLSGRVNFIVMIYNPIKSRGYAVEARDKPDRWISLNWNAEDTIFGDPAMDIPIQARNADLLERYGRDSNVYRIRVLGKPPIADTDVFIPWDWVQEAINRNITPGKDDLVIMGVDPAAGGDNSVIVVRHGGKIISLERFNEPDTMRFAERVVKSFYKFDPVVVNIDSIGVGKGVYDRVNKLLPGKIESIDVRKKARDRDEYELVRDELWGTLREQFELGHISIPNDQELQDQLGSIRIKNYTKKGKAQIPTKAEMHRKDSIGGSPDEADAICLTYAIPDYMLRKRHNPEDEDEKEERLRKKRLRMSGGNSVTGY